MHSLNARANAIFFFGLTVLGVFTALNSLSVYTYVSQPNVSVRFNSVKDFSWSPRLDADHMKLFFDLDADFTSVWNWNVKQLFVWVEAEYTSDKNMTNQVVVWDRIIRQKDNAKVKLVKALDKYRLKARMRDLRNKDVTLRVKWQVMPIAGTLFFDEAGSHVFRVPNAYSS
eukprot:GILJ01004164.1.p1 GENE.GILJ01004164.1~~GILJ01004164.1.p1  ORF type:complete len:171 (+),score=26.60 GILJ01004164.1:50-562(+)